MLIPWIASRLFFVSCVGRVDEVEIQILHAELPEARAQRGLGRVEAVVGVPELRGEEDLVSRKPRVRDGLEKGRTPGKRSGKRM